MRVGGAEQVRRLCNNKLPTRDPLKGVPFIVRPKSQSHSILRVYLFGRALLLRTDVLALVSGWGRHGFNGETIEWGRDVDTVSHKWNDEFYEYIVEEELFFISQNFVLEFSPPKQQQQQCQLLPSPYITEKFLCSQSVINSQNICLSLTGSWPPRTNYPSNSFSPTTSLIIPS